MYIDIPAHLTSESHNKLIDDIDFGSIDKNFYLTINLNSLGNEKKVKPNNNIEDINNKSKSESVQDSKEFFLDVQFTNLPCCLNISPQTFYCFFCYKTCAIVNLEQHIKGRLHKNNSENVIIKDFIATYHRFWDCQEKR